MTWPRSQSSKWRIRTYTQACPPVRTSWAHWKGWKQALPPPPLVHLHCRTSMMSSARITAWRERKQGLPEMTCSSTMTRIGFAQSSVCREWPEGHAASQRRTGTRAWQGCLAPSVQPPGRALPQHGAEEKAAESPPSPRTRLAWRKQVHWNGFLLPLHLQTGPGFLLQRLDLLEASLPPLGTLTACLPGPLPSASPSPCMPPQSLT